MHFLFRLYPMIRGLLFKLDAEDAHKLTLSVLRHIHACSLTRRIMPSSEIQQGKATVMGLKVFNRIGLAAGLDKNGQNIDALGDLGFGFIEIGTITPLPQVGNPKPRVFRIPKKKALVNCLGFNNRGLDICMEYVQSSDWRKRGGILGINIGKNLHTPIQNASDDYVAGLKGAYPHADYITINISSPNTQHLRSLQEKNQLSALLATLTQKRKELADVHQRYVPLAVKISPDLTLGQIDTISEILVRHNIDGIIATNTVSKDMKSAQSTHIKGHGGLSGLPIHETSLSVLAHFKKRLGNTLTIIGVGGILSGKEACEKIAAGADALQLYTGLIYRGPILIPECVNAIEKV